MISMFKFKSQTLISLMLMVLVSLTSCSKTSLSLVTATPSAISQPTITPSPTAIPTPTIPLLPKGVDMQNIDGVDTEPQRDNLLHTWVWRNKLGEVRRLLDPLRRHLLVKTSSPEDRLSYEIDLDFLWEANLVNYINYAPHAPFGTGYIQLLKTKYPHDLPDGNGTTGIVFRILQGNLAVMSDKLSVTFFSDVGTPEERVFLAPTYNPDTNEYTFAMLISTDFLTKKGALNTYTDWMLNYCINSEYPQNPSGSWGIQLYEHPIKK